MVFILNGQFPTPFLVLFSVFGSTMQRNRWTGARLGMGRCVLTRALGWFCLISMQPKTRTLMPVSVSVRMWVCAFVFVCVCVLSALHCESEMGVACWVG